MIHEYTHTNSDLELFKKKHEIELFMLIENSTITRVLYYNI